MSGWFEAIRAECSRPTWSRGVELVRADAVRAQRVGPGEAVLRVTNPDGLLAPTVTLFLDGAAWDCDCPGLDDPCEHVAAAAIALRRQERDGVAQPDVAGSGAGHVPYCLFRDPPGLSFERRIAAGERATRLDASLQSIARGTSDGPEFLATEADLAAERALAASGLLRGRGRVGPGALERLLPALAACADVRLDGEPVAVSAEPVVPRGHVRDRGDAFVLTVERDPAVTEALGEGVALCGDTLRPVRESRLTARELRELPGGRLYPAERALELASEVIPDLSRRIPVEVHTRRLPRADRGERPRVLVGTERRGDALVARADLVYGDPPRARIEDGRLVGVTGPVPVRDEPAERRAAGEAQRALGLPVGAEVTATDAEALALAARIAAWPGAVRGRAHEEFRPAPALEPRVHPAARDFEVRFECPAEEAGAPPRRVSADAVLRAWEAGLSLVPLTGGGFAPLPADWLARFGRAARDLLDARAADGSLPARALPDLARFCEALGEPPPPELGPLRALLSEGGALPRVALPTDLAGVLRGYQERGVAWLGLLRDAGLGALLADDMGLGKTLQVLCALRGRALVVAPTSALHVWREELRRFRPALRVCVYHGAGRALDAAADVTLTTYAVLRLDAEVLARAAWDAAVLDESQAIKNPDSQVARAAHALRARWRVAVTGTPVENRLEELWSQLHFTNPGLLGSRARFRERYAAPIAAGQEGPARELRARVRPFLLRRAKGEVATELPPRTETTLRCELSEAERGVYDAVRAATRDDVVARLRAGGNVLGALEALLRLRQAACHRGLVPGQSAETSSKVELLLEELDTTVAEGHKALVFSQWTGLLDRVEPHLGAAEIDFGRLDGATRDRSAVVERFQTDDGPPVLLVSLRAGGTGLTLTAADHVFLLDPWWNPAVEDQAADRAHRIGQTRPVIVHRLVAADTVEERILDLQARKRALADAALGGAAAAELSRDELLALLD